MQFMPAFVQYYLKCQLCVCKICKETALKEENIWESQFLSE